MTLLNTAKRALFSVALATLCAGAAQASTVTLTDGTLAESANAQTGVGIQQALGAEFNAASGPMTFSGTLSRSAGASLGGGVYNLGMTVGNVYFLVHPGYSGSAFRFDSVNLATSLVSPGSNGSNKNIGYTADSSDIDFEVILTASGANYSFDVSIEQTGVGSFSNTYTLAQSIFGAGGAISSFGAFHNGLGTGFGAIDYKDFTASVAAVPLPAAFPLLLLAVGGLGAVSRRRKTS